MRRSGCAQIQNLKSEILCTQLLFFTKDSTMLLWLLLLWTATNTTTAFVGLPHHHQVFYQNRAARAPRPPQAHDESSSSSSSTPEEEDAVDDWRQILEASWKADGSMGRVPTTPEQAAEACASALQEAVRDNRGSGGGVYLVDLRLPQYDRAASPDTSNSNPQQQPHNRWYDEVRVVEFGVALAEQLSSSSSTEILVRDAQVLQTVTRVLNAREPGSVSPSCTPKTPPPPAIITPEEEEEDTAPFYDDFADFGGPIGGDDAGFAAATDDTDSKASNTKNADENSATDAADSPPSASLAAENSSSSEDVDSFRAQLASSWNSADSSSAASDIPAEERLEEATAAEQGEKPGTESDRRCYRLASLFGDATISTGPDMTDDVTDAVSANAKPTDGEDTIVVLSPISPEEIVAVRALVGTYKSTKTIVLVNCCRLARPVPRELMGAVTVYSILPLLAKPANSNGNEEETRTPKVLLLRRYPRDWEVYVDVGGEDNAGGFDLAASIPDGSVPIDGPSMEWLREVVQRYLQSRQRQ